MNEQKKLNATYFIQGVAGTLLITTIVLLIIYL